jgi:quinol monooxygenase YgiN
MINLGLYVRLEAKAGKENDVEEFLRSALPLAESESGTIAWFALRLGPRTFGIFDAFADEKGREAHLAGQVAATLLARAPELLAGSPVIEKAEVLASKLPRSERARAA